MGHSLYLLLKSWMKIAEKGYQTAMVYGETISEQMSFLRECKNRDGLWKSLDFDKKQMDAPLKN